MVRSSWAATTVERQAAAPAAHARRRPEVPEVFEMRATPLTRPGRRPSHARLLAALTILLLLPAALAQGALPSNAAEAIERGERAMEEALSTYDAQFPDRPLWQEAFREGRTAVELAPGHP